MTENNKKPITQVVCAVLYNRDEKFLMNTRPPDKVCAGDWEFPGGKVELGENPEAALMREVKEELDLTMKQVAPWVCLKQTLPHAQVCLHFYRSWWVSGQAKPMENQKLGLFDAQHLPIPHLPAVARIREFLQLPTHWIRLEGSFEALAAQVEEIKQRQADALIVSGAATMRVADIKALVNLPVWVSAKSPQKALKEADGLFVERIEDLAGLPSKPLAVPALPEHWGSFEKAGAVMAYTQGIQVGSSAWHNLFQANPVPIFLSGIKISSAHLLRPHGAQGWIESL